MTRDDGELRPYLYRSALLHAGLAAAILFIIRLPKPPSEETFRIDFVGPSSVIINRNPESSPAEGPSKAAIEPISPQTDKDEFATRPRHAPLPRPSVLSGSLETNTPAAAPSAAPASEQPKDQPGGSGDAAVSANMPNFPYPWYISQVRAALWNQWSGKMPKGGGEATVEFSILRDGSGVDVRVESSSGEPEFDYVALGAVQGALPFPPLPAGFPDKFLKIHVRFKSQ